MEVATDIYGISCTLICHDSHKFRCQTDLRFLELIKTFLSLGVENVCTFNEIILVCPEQKGLYHMANLR